MKELLKHIGWYLLLGPLFAWIIFGYEVITVSFMLQALLIGIFTYPLVNANSRKKIAGLVWKKESSA
jgi:hypothetical protein